MISNELNTIVTQLKQKGKMIFLAGATENQIEEFEKKHNLKLPLKYREWLLFSDGGEFFLPAGLQMYGVAHKPIIDVSEDDRPSDNYVVIGSWASGDRMRCEKSGERISIYNPEAGVIESDEIFEDFFAFLNDLYEILGIGGGFYVKQDSCSP